MSQIPLHIIHKSNYSEDDYFITESNDDAKKWVDNWPNWGDAPFSNITVIFGEPGSGKTHLSKIWQRKSDALSLTREMLCSQDYVEQAADAFLLEDINNLQGADESLFNLINYCLNNKKFLMLTTSNIHFDKDFTLPDLLSRLRSIVAINIYKPNQEMFEQILFKNLSDRQITIDPKVISYLSKRLNRSYPEINRIVKQLDELSLAQKNKLTIPLIKKSFELD